jgi:hypothetical protein
MDDRKFTHENVEYKVTRPNNKIRKESDTVYAKAYRKAISEGLFLEAEIDNIIKERGIKAYNDKEKKEFEKEIKDLESKLLNDSFTTQAEGYDAYERIVALRKSLEDLDKAKRELSTQSATMYAENERFAFFVASCSLTSSGEKIWANIGEYKDDISDLANRFATEMIHIIYDGTQEILAELEKIRPENIWYKDHIVSSQDGENDNEESEKSLDLDTTDNSVS